MPQNALRNSRKRQGRKSAAQTPSPKADRIYGSSKNPKRSASSNQSGASIQFTDSIINGLKNKMDAYNKKHPNNKVTLSTLKAVFRRGAGAYSKSHRPTITGGVPNTRNAWAYARVNKFLLKKGGTKVKAAYVQDDDLMEHGGQINLLAPNGKKSNLTPEQYKLVRTPQFKAWFGDWENDPENASKVVDDNGEPKVYYQGQFYAKYPKGNYVFEKDNNGIFFSSNKRIAESYGVLKSMFIKVLNPKDVRNYYGYDNKKISYRKRNDNKYWSKSIDEKEYINSDPTVVKFYEDVIDKYANKVLEILDKKNGKLNEYKNKKEIKEFLIPTSKQGFKFLNFKYKSHVWDLVAKYIKDSKYDGLFATDEDYRAEDIADSIVVYNSKQIKLADGSNTKFDADNPDIRYEGGGETDNQVIVNKYSIYIGTPETTEIVDATTDEAKAYNIYEQTDRSDSENPNAYGLYKELNLESKTYKFIGELEEEESIEDYMDEDYYEDNSLWRLVDEDYKDLERITFPEVNEKTDLLVSEVRSHYGAKNGYARIPIGTEYLTLRIKDHTGNVQNKAKGDSKYFLSVVISEKDPTSRFKQSEKAIKSSEEIYFGENSTLGEILAEINEHIQYYKAMEGVKYAEGGLIAPNGKPSNLTPEQYKLVRTPQFKAWFGDWMNDPENASKVVDENGEPLVVYHYSPNEFTIFDKTKHPQFVDVVENKKHKPLGYDFSTREGFYESKTRNKKYSVFLNAKNVFDFREATENEYQKIIKLLSKIPYYSTHSFQLDLDIKYLKSGDWGLLERPTLEKYFSKNYDGLFMLERDWFNIKVYNSNQIKLADGSNTTFDGNDSDIRYEDGGELFSAPPKNEAEYIPLNAYRQSLINFYYDQNGNMKYSSREVPYKGYLPKVGSWRIDSMSLLDGRMIDKLVVLDMDDLIPVELSDGKLDVTKRGDDETYSNWLKQGLRSIPIEVVQTPSGKFKIIDGHRRYLAHKLAGKDKIEAWVSPNAISPRGTNVGLTFELANDIMVNHLSYKKGGLTFEQKYGKYNYVNLTPADLDDYAEDMYNLIQNAYSHIGGHLEFQTPEAVRNTDLNFWVASDIDQDPDMDVLLGGKKTNYGTKITTLAQDGERASKVNVAKKAYELLSKKGFYAEVDEALAEKLKVPIITDERIIRKVIGKPDIEMNEDGTYYRNIQGKRKKKILVGMFEHLKWGGKLYRKGGATNKYLDDMNILGNTDVNEPQEASFEKGGKVQSDYAKWKKLVNMSASELEAFYNSDEGKVAGLTPSQAKSQGIDSGRESARWILKMKKTPYSEWTPQMHRWANKQISFISRMSGMKGNLIYDKGRKTRKHLSLLIWGHNPKKSMQKGGGLTEKKSISGIAKKHNTKLEYLYKQLREGVKVEMEHTDNRKIAEKIALDHLDEMPDYYVRLKKIESHKGK